MTHPITPPPKLLQQWINEHFGNTSCDPFPCEVEFAARVAQWGADQELEACCAIALTDPVCGTKHQRRMLVSHIREQRRPKPLSLKEQALETLKYPKDLWSEAEVNTIRRALEQLDD